MGVSQYNKVTCLCILYLCYNFNPLQPSVAFLYPLKTSENLNVFWCFRGYRTAKPDCNGLNSLNHVKYFFAIVLFREKLPLLSHQLVLLKHLKLFRKLQNRNNTFHIAYWIRQKLEKKNNKKIKPEGKNGVNVFKNYLN